VKNTPKEELERKDFRLPVIVPIVLYNGEGNWTAPLSYKESLAGYQLFEDYVLDFKYFLLDVKRYTEEELLELANLIGSVFLVDQRKRDIMGLFDLLKRLLDILKKLPSRHIKIFFRWLTYVVVPLLPKPLQRKAIEEMKKAQPEEVEKVISNLGRSIEDALTKAKSEGKREGEKEALVKVVKNMLSMRVEEGMIAQMTGFSMEEIRAIRAKMPPKI